MLTKTGTSDMNLTKNAARETLFSENPGANIRTMKGANRNKRSAMKNKQIVLIEWTAFATRKASSLF